MDKATQKLQQRIRAGSTDILPRLSDMQFCRYAPAMADEATQVDYVDDFMWAIYISHDPCHDGTRLGNRNTVIAMNRTNGTWRVIGRELPMEHALPLAYGEV